VNSEDIFNGVVPIGEIFNLKCVGMFFFLFLLLLTLIIRSWSPCVLQRVGAYFHCGHDMSTSRCCFFVSSSTSWCEWSEKQYITCRLYVMPSFSCRAVPKLHGCLL